MNNSAQPAVHQTPLEFWTGVRKDYATGVLNHLEELRSHVPNSSKTSWFIQLDWKKIKERELVGLILALECLQVEFDELLSPEGRYFFEELSSQLHRTKKRMLGAKHLHFSFTPELVEELVLEEPEYLPSIREFNGNFRIDPQEVLKRLFRIRFHKVLRATRTQRVRGYRDKGSESSPSERARRAANTSSWNQYLQEVLEYCQMTGCHPRQALRLFNMEPEGG